MNNYLKILCLALVVFSGSALAVPSMPVNVNLLSNPGFEDAVLGNWTFNGGGSGSITSDAFTGTQAALVNYTANFAGMQQFVQIYPGVDVGETFQLDFAVKNEVGVTANQGLGFQVLEWDSTVGFGAVHQILGWSGPAWNMSPLTFQLQDPGTNYLLVQFVGHTTLPGSFIIDHTSLMKTTPEPATLAILGFGALGLLRKRK